MRPWLAVRSTREETLSEQKNLARMCYDEQSEGRSQARVPDKRRVEHWYNAFSHARFPQIPYQIPKCWPHTGFVQRGSIRRPRAVSTLNSFGRTLYLFPYTLYFILSRFVQHDHVYSNRS